MIGINIQQKIDCRQFISPHATAGTNAASIGIKFFKWETSVILNANLKFENIAVCIYV